MAAPSPPQTNCRVDSSGVGLNVVTLGQQENPPVVLVHGYPDTHRVWLPVARELAKNFFVILYDVRGAGGSDAPGHVGDYRLEVLSRDLEAVVNAILPHGKTQRFHLVGHDWGSIQSWESVTTRPLNERIASFTSISGPALDHVVHWAKARARSDSKQDRRAFRRQLLSSAYIGFFHLPLLPALVWRLWLGRAWPHYLARREGALEAQPSPTQTQDGIQGVNLYRANFGPKLRNPEQRYAKCPVQLIVPLRDRFVRPHLFDDLSRWVPQLHRREIEATHWVPLSYPEPLAELIADFVKSIE